MAGHKVFRVLNNLKTEFALMRTEEYTGILEYLHDRSTNPDFDASIAMANKIRKQDEVQVEGGIAKLEISGAISHLPTEFEAMCGVTSYLSITQDMESIITDSSVHTVVMDIDSGGGAAKGCFITANRIRELADENGIKLVGYTESLAASAAYALLSVAHEVIVSPDADVGSIGVITQFANYSKKLKKDGIEVVTFKSGKNKDLGNPYRKMTDDEKAHVQERVDTISEGFFSHVAQYRRMSVETIKDLQAGVYTGTEALELGLVDKVMLPHEFQAYLVDLNDSKTEGVAVNHSTRKNLKTKEREVVMSTETDINLDVEPSAEILAELAELRSTVEAQNASLEEQATMLQENATELQKRQDALTANKLADFEAKALNWKQFGMDSKAYATLALDANVELLAMVEDALDTAVKVFDESASMEEIGVIGEGEGLVTEDATTKAIKAKYNDGEA